jgi:hypothetical protein
LEVYVLVLVSIDRWHEFGVVTDDIVDLVPFETLSEPIGDSGNLRGIQRTDWVDIPGTGIILGGETQQRLITVIVTDH